MRQIVHPSGRVTRVLTVRGIERRVGTIRQPSEADRLWLAAKGFLHHWLARVAPEAHAAGALVAPATLDLITPCAAQVATMLANGPDPSNPPTCPNGVGDCMIAEDIHLAAIRATLAGAPWVPQTADALSTYSAVTGYDPANPNTDQGTDPTALLRYREGGAPYPDGSKLVAAFNVDATDWAAYTQALWLADGLLQWASLPDGVESEENGGDVWDVCGDPDDANGHGFGAGGYDADAADLVEWGMVPPIRATRAFVAKYLVPSAGGGCVALIGSNAFASITGKCPAGLDLSGLESALAALGQAA